MKNDPEFNIRFVKVVEKYPQLYNYTLESYSSKQEVDKAWNEIAKTLNETVINVVAKWTTLRNNFNRSLRESAKFGPHAENKKNYYLAQYMEFLLPYLKSRNNERRDQKSVHQEIESSQDILASEDSANGFGDDTLHEEQATFPSISATNENFSLKSHKYMPYTEGSKKPRNDADRSTDVAFFQSLLPLIENLNDSEKIRFRISCMQTLQCIVDKVESDSTNRCANSINTPMTNETQRHAQLEVQCGDSILHPSGVSLKFEYTNPIE